MIDKLFIFRAMIIAIMLCLLSWDSLLWLTQHGQPLPHRDLLLTGALLWIVSVFFPKNSDDDLAGQF